MIKRIIYILAFLMISGALALRAEYSPLEDPLAPTTSPKGNIFSELFPASPDHSYRSSIDRDPVPNLFDPLLAEMLKQDSSGRRGQGVGFDAEIAGRLIQSAPVTTAPVAGNPDGALLEPDVSAAPTGLPQQSTAVVEGFSVVPLVLIGSGVLILMILGIIQLRAWRNKP